MRLSEIQTGTPYDRLVTHFRVHWTRATSIMIKCVF